MQRYLPALLGELFNSKLNDQNATVKEFTHIFCFIFLI
ncbi:hypothetical protein NHE_0581 [Neorickettsia helminthoeca str. Oregon]|uniref:Uncharacterized protein n=1 Tax=Neorickettsia helminthoeca str. Oregon TaxID=1286528 RepID=X5HKF8_9RICK|nr:hypothetical protein NHE_0581 [Neorickettsia helminthoeca str. Oregon]